jgi:hypothetical protein
MPSPPPISSSPEYPHTKSGPDDPRRMSGRSVPVTSNTAPAGFVESRSTPSHGYRASRNHVRYAISPSTGDHSGRERRCHA